MCQQTGPKHRQAVHKSPAGSVQRKGCREHKLCRFEEDGAELHHLSVGGGTLAVFMISTAYPLLLCQQETLRNQKTPAAEITGR
ncbi:hypothetical protein Hamer_G008120 [Homarus americanus]|uniref:Uncharacterized protein n=1 Tax=Homarus americanus TaxID=6706 RepID=A0A8J5JR18_HOMAM|nr:hypothetical protein Hamer_G008120 [Homarus americanus]